MYRSYISDTIVPNAKWLWLFPIWWKLSGAKTLSKVYYLDAIIDSSRHEDNARFKALKLIYSTLQDWYDFFEMSLILIVYIMNIMNLNVGNAMSFLLLFCLVNLVDVLIYAMPLLMT